MRANGFEARTIKVAGGVTRSPLWLQIHADVTGVPLQLTRCPDGPALGCAILAAAAAGVHPSVAAAARAMTEVVSTVEPDPANTARYEETYQAYCRLYQAAKSVC